MKIFKLLPLLLLISLSGCKLVGPSIEVSGPKVIVDGNPSSNGKTSNHGKHCPPGQAKKGKC